MKELSIEEKAKRYDEAIERAKSLLSGNQLGNAWIYKLLPELKELGEDERIRKGLLYVIEHHPTLPTEEAEEYIAWLEKQGESYTKKDVDDAYLKGVTDTKNEIEKQYEANYQIRKDIATFIFNYKGDIKDRAKWMDYLGIKVSFVEKQGEQKPDNKVDLATKSYITPNSKFFQWIYDRLIYVHHENSDVDYMRSLKERIEDMENTEWSEVDESLRLRTIGALETCKIGSPTKCVDEQINWLKSLKDRILPQSKQEWKQENTGDLNDFENAMMHIANSFFGQYAGLDPNDTNVIKEQANLLLELVPNKEWSKEDENNILFLTSIIEECFKDKENITLCGDTNCANFTKEDVINRLKSLRPNYWKPSEEQLKALHWCVMNVGSTEHQVLQELLEQLEKLKG